MNIYNKITRDKSNNKKTFALLIDPDRQDKQLISLVNKANKAKVDYFCWRKPITNNNLELCISTIKENSYIPTILFPGNAMQVNNKADAILFCR